MERDFSGAFARCQQFIIAADVWYGSDILRERLPEPGYYGEKGYYVSNE